MTIGVRQDSSVKKLWMASSLWKDGSGVDKILISHGPKKKSATDDEVLRKFVVETLASWKRLRGQFAFRWKLLPFSKYGPISVGRIERTSISNLKDMKVTVTYRHHDAEFSRDFVGWPTAMEFMLGIMGWQTGVVSVYNERELEP